MIPGLLITAGSKRGYYIEFIEEQAFWVGRIAPCNLVLEDEPKVSKQHCFFLRKGGQLVVQDESSNGTRLNGRKLHNEMALLKNADIICLGNTHLQVVDSDDEQPEEIEFDFDACLEDIRKRKKAGDNPDMFEGVGPYRTIEVIGSGTSGRVYKAVDTNEKRLVALKVLSTFRGLSHEFMGRFLREAKLLEKLDHSFIIRIYDTNTSEVRGHKYSYIALEYFQGVDLSVHVRSNGSMLWQEVFKVLYQLTDALQYMHSKGILHRDLKPSNVMYNNVKGIAKIIDLGLGKCVLDEERETLFATEPNSSLGLPNYIPIEQWESAKDVDQRADIDSLGITAYFLLTGKLPYGKYQNITKLYDAVVNQKLAPIEEVCNQSMPSEFLEIIKKMIAFEADDRYPDSKSLLQELENLALKLKVSL